MAVQIPVRRGRESIREETVGEIENVISIYDSVVKTDNEALNVILTEKSLICRKNRISLTCMADGAGLDFMDASDIYSLFGNLIDNAMDAVSKLDDHEKRIIGLSVHADGNMLAINVNNYYEGVVVMDSDGLPVTTKQNKDFHGYGMKSVRMIVERYGGETYSYWLTKMGTTTKNVLDNLVKAGKCEPTIVVCPTFESKPEGYNDLFRAADWTRYYPLELRNDLIAAVETEYSTYLGDDASYENMVATRDHRGFAGFSMGSMTSLQVMTQCSDLVSYIGSYSASMYADRTGAEAWEEIKAGITRDEVKNYKINYWFNMNGTADMALGPHEQLNEAVMADKDGLFTNGVNYAWILVPGGSHAYNCWVMGLYDCMLVFFK